MFVFFLTFYGFCFAQDIEEVNPQDVIDEVNQGIDDMNCGLNELSQAVQNSMNDVIDEINDTIRSILEQYDLECLMSMLDVSFSGVFNIDLTIPSFCEIALDLINSEDDSSLLKIDIQKRASLKQLLENNIKAKNKFKNDVTNKW